MIDVPLKSRIYFCDLNKYALSLTVSLFKSALEEFQTDPFAIVLLIPLFPNDEFTWPDTDFVG